MKMIVTLVFLVLSSNAFAVGTCPNLNGVFKVSETAAIRLTQNECVSLSVAWGEFEEQGKIRWFGPEKAMLNGAETCNTFGCVTGKTNAEKIEVARNNPWTLQNAEHGICDYYQVSYSLDAQGKLVSKPNLYNCQDSFMGVVEIVLPRIK